MTGNTSSKATVLVVEDDPIIAQAVAERLTTEGFAVEVATDGPSAVAAHEQHPPDVMVLDVMLPGFDGLEVCRRTQSRRPTPVLMLTARDDELDVLTGLAVGADDYLTKPFSMRELVARVSALLRRVERAAELAAEAPVEISLPGISLDSAARTVTVEGKGVHLTPTEFDLLRVLATNADTVLSRRHLMEVVWGWPDADGTRTLDSHIRSVRSKIGGHRIRTVHGVGYAFASTKESSTERGVDHV